jgi:ribosomal protein S12
MRGKKDFQFKAEHKNPDGGLNAKGRAAYNRATGSNLKAPQPEGGPRKKSFCARSAGQMKMFPEAAKDPNSRLRKARRKWDC